MPWQSTYDYILSELRKERMMKQHPLPLPPSADELQLDNYRPIRYCANCSKVVAANEAINTNTKSFCTLTCQRVYARSLL
jgi:hypothetical protein